MLLGLGWSVKLRVEGLRVSSFRDEGHLSLGFRAEAPRV